MKNWFTILLLIILGKSVLAQGDSAFQLVKTYPFEVADAMLDNLDNLYIITPQDQLKKYNINGDSVAAFNGVKRFGKLHSVDVSNPMKLLLFYKDFSRIVMLDRLLTVRGTIDLKQNNIMQASAVGASYDNKIWIFDSYEYKLKKLDEQGSLLQETSDFRILFDQSIVPQQILDRDGLLYLYDTTSGLFVFDYYGTFKRKLPLSNWNSIVIAGKNVLGISNNGINNYSTATLMESRYMFPQNFLRYYRYSLSQNKLIALSKNSVSIFSYRH
ncbi:hypothetical protein OCK74_18315 [Chitinophagaceae bacterium LB-8]|uniref:6-bladed beta-propeller n=1 Tax=Paraflavisolibacter caeni TaxID=2982496 RepID=A0A9X2XYG7_9BACT|nr:hypothetical protein [Paraflavisolibacter caeni]MCU7551080.1 hypothetical protein [Paraflavisolibacter caeni]